MDKRLENMLKDVAVDEAVSFEKLVDSFKNGSVAVFKNYNRKTKPTAVGEGLKVKVNANIGTSNRCSDINKELEKVAVCEEAGADAIMDLSTGGDLDKIRREILAATRLPVGTVPIYEVAYEIMFKKKKGIENMEFGQFLEVVEKQAEEGIKIAVEQIQELKEVEGIRGFHIMAKKALIL